MTVVTQLPQIRGDKAPANLHEEAMRVLANDRRVGYEAHEFTIPTPTTAESIKTLINHLTECTCARASGFLGVINRGARVSIRNTGAAPIQVRYNTAASDPISIEDGEAHDWDFTEVDDIFFTNEGGAAVLVRVLIA